VAYTTLAIVRAMEGMADSAVFTNATIESSILEAVLLIDDYTGTSWESAAWSITVDGTNTNRLTLEDPFDGQRRILFPRTISSVTVDGVNELPAAADWALFPEGFIIRDSGTFTYTKPGRNVVIAGTAGAATVVPVDIALVARTLARQYTLDTVSRVDDRAVMMTTEMGTIRLSQPGARWPTGMPQLDAILNRRRHIGPAVA
jgi:hypothetical protein